MKSYDVIGYTADADTFCPACAREWYGNVDADPAPLDHEGNEVHPIFADSEWDSIPACARCGGVLDGISLTSEGMDYTRRALLAPWNGEPADRDAWIEVYRDNGGDLTVWAYGIGSAGSLFDSISGPYDSEDDAAEALRETLQLDNEYAGGARDADDVWDEVEPVLWVRRRGTYYAEVFEVDGADGLDPEWAEAYEDDAARAARLAQGRLFE